MGIVSRLRDCGAGVEERPGPELGDRRATASSSARFIRSRLGSKSAAATSRSYRARSMIRKVAESFLSERGLPTGAREATSRQKSSGTRPGSIRSTTGNSVPALGI